MIAMLQANSTPRIQVKYHIKNPLTDLVKRLKLLQLSLGVTTFQLRGGVDISSSTANLASI